MDASRPYFQADIVESLNAWKNFCDIVHFQYIFSHALTPPFKPRDGILHPLVMNLLHFLYFI